MCRCIDNMTFENSDEGGESHSELPEFDQRVGLSQCNGMVEDVQTTPEENYVAQLLTDEEIIEQALLN
ncbi:hypothetical protein Tco_1504487 [Tanacetum coccineum]